MARGPTQRTLTIYLVDKAIRDVQSMIRSGLEHHPVTANGHHLGDLYVKVSHLHPPPWVSFFAVPWTI
jgi:hypothetical protein